MGIPHSVIRESLFGFDTNPTVWALAALNMFFRGDGKSNIENASCFDEKSKQAVSDRFTKALLNPPFSQEEEPEFCPEQYLPQPDFPETDKQRYREDVVKSILRTAVSIDDIAEEVIENFPEMQNLPEMPYGTEGCIEKYFYVKGGKSSGESNYSEGSCPYVSSGDPLNSIIRLVADVDGEVFNDGAITVTCFGRASVQPWRFMARGNGGSAVRILIPKFKMTFSELVWFAAQINMQRWRFFYGRMAILKRLKKIQLSAPQARLEDTTKSIAEKVAELSNKVTDILGE